MQYFAAWAALFIDPRSCRLCSSEKDTFGVTPQEIGSGEISSGQGGNKQPLFWKIRTPEYPLPPVTESIRSLLNKQLISSPTPLPVAEWAAGPGTNIHQPASNHSEDSSDIDDGISGLEEMSGTAFPASITSECNALPMAKEVQDTECGEGA